MDALKYLTCVSSAWFCTRICQTCHSRVRLCGSQSVGVAFHVLQANGHDGRETMFMHSGMGKGSTAVASASSTQRLLACSCHLSRVAVPSYAVMVSCVVSELPCVLFVGVPAEGGFSTVVDQSTGLVIMSHHVVPCCCVFIHHLRSCVLSELFSRSCAKK